MSIFSKGNRPSKTVARLRGDYGEDAAVRYLRKKHFRIRVRNLQFGGREEIDIIAEDKQTRRYIEVKTRRQSPDAPSRYGTPSDAVTKDKQAHLLSAARRYEEKKPTKKSIQFDIIEVYLDPAYEEPTLLAIRHLEDAFRG